MRKVYVTVTTRLVINANDGVAIDDVLSEMEYEFTSTDCSATIEDTEILDWSVSDAK